MLLSITLKRQKWPNSQTILFLSNSLKGQIATLYEMAKRKSEREDDRERGGMGKKCESYRRERERERERGDIFLFLFGEDNTLNLDV